MSRAVQGGGLRLVVGEQDGVEAGQRAASRYRAATPRRAGQSIQVLFRCYAKFLAEPRNHASTLIEESMRWWDGPESGA